MSKRGPRQPPGPCFLWVNAGLSIMSTMTIMRQTTLALTAEVRRSLSSLAVASQETHFGTTSGGSIPHRSAAQVAVPTPSSTPLASALNAFMAALSVKIPVTCRRGFGVPFLPPCFSTSPPIQ